MVRYDRASGEAIDIRPEPLKGELTYKWNWNTPLFISPHKNTRLYTAANKVFKSDDRGDTWEVISDDLTRQIDRNSFMAMGKYWSIDAVAKDRSTSLFGTIISLAASPVTENLLYAGTDDGLIQVSEDGKTWRKISEFSGVPEYTYVSDICPSKFDENIVYASFDNLKRDDFNPYVLKSVDKGKSWTSISSNLPKNGTVHSIEQDFVNPDLLFVGTEFGIFFSINDGESWTQLKNGIPTIAVKDIVIQERENDLVLATFGRGFYILDNYSPLRDLNKELLNKEAHIFPIKDALMYHQSGGRYGQGETYFKADNPEYGAVFSYYIKDVPKTLKQIRKEKEKELFKDSKPIPQPSNEELIAEKMEKSPYLIFTIKDSEGLVVRKLTASASKGVNRINWDLRYESVYPQKTVDEFNPTNKARSSTLALPGNYNVSLSIVTREGIKEIAGPVNFTAKALENTSLPAADRNELVAFQKNANELTRSILGAEVFVEDLMKRTETLKQVILKTPEADYSYIENANSISSRLKEISLKFNRDSKYPSAEENPPANPTFMDRLGILSYTHWRSTSNITNNERNAYKILVEEFPPILNELRNILSLEIKPMEEKLEKLKAPYSEGRIPQFEK